MLIQGIGRSGRDLSPRVPLHRRRFIRAAPDVLLQADEIALVSAHHLYQYNVLKNLEAGRPAVPRDNSRSVPHPASRIGITRRLR